MKISKAKLRQIIKEELAATLEEDYDEGRDDDDMIDAVMLGREDGATGKPARRNQVARQMTGHYDAAFNRAAKKSK
jgi:hypothetical protein